MAGPVVCITVTFCFSRAVPNVSFENFAPGFVEKFIESHTVMLTGNAGLKPKEGEYTSRPWEWPMALRVIKVGAFVITAVLFIFSSPLQGQWFSGKDHRVYLLGNPIIWWGNIAFLLLFAGTYGWNSLRAQRGYSDTNTETIARKEKSLYAGVWLLIGWALHYIPFWMMGRVLYYHHYFPSCLSTLR